jgi:hypothetical protein
MRGRCPGRIYVRNRPRFANLPKMPNPDTKLLEKYFSHFTKNFRMPNLYAKLLEMLYTAPAHAILDYTARRFIYMVSFLVQHVHIFAVCCIFLDIDECARPDLYPCYSDCINMPGTFLCQCKGGTYGNPLKKGGCKYTDVPIYYLIYFITKKTIRSYSLYSKL